MVKPVSRLSLGATTIALAQAELSEVWSEWRRYIREFRKLARLSYIAEDEVARGQIDLSAF